MGACGADDDVSVVFGVIRQKFRKLRFQMIDDNTKQQFDW